MKSKQDLSYIYSWTKILFVVGCNKPCNAIK